MKRKWLYIIFSCVFLGFLLFVVNIFTTERKKEKNTEFPVIYNVEYMEYKEEQWDRFKIYVPYVENLGNQDLEKTINNVLKQEAVTWLMNDNIFSKGHKSMKPRVICQSKQILSIELPYRSVGGRFISFVNHYITIDMQTGRKITYSELIENEGKLIDLFRDGKSIFSDGTIYDNNQNILLYDEGKGKTTVETHADFYISENAFSITYVEGTCRYYVSIGLEILKKEGVINMAYFS